MAQTVQTMIGCSPSLVRKINMLIQQPWMTKRLWTI